MDCLLCGVKHGTQGVEWHWASLSLWPVPGRSSSWASSSEAHDKHAAPSGSLQHSRSSTCPSLQCPTQHAVHACRGPT